MNIYDTPGDWCLLVIKEVNLESIHQTNGRALIQYASGHGLSLIFFTSIMLIASAYVVRSHQRSCYGVRVVDLLFP